MAENEYDEHYNYHLKSHEILAGTWEELSKYINIDNRRENVEMKLGVCDAGRGWGIFKEFLLDSYFKSFSE